MGGGGNCDEGERKKGDGSGECMVEINHTDTTMMYRALPEKPHTLHHAK